MLMGTPRSFSTYDVQQLYTYIMSYKSKRKASSVHTYDLHTYLHRTRVRTSLTAFIGSIYMINDSTGNYLDIYNNNKQDFFFLLFLFTCHVLNNFASSALQNKNAVEIDTVGCIMRLHIYIVYYTRVD